MKPARLRLAPPPRHRQPRRCRLAAKDAAWKTAHRFKIEGYEAKKRWAEAERMREIQRANELGRMKKK